MNKKTIYIREFVTSKIAFIFYGLIVLKLSFFTYTQYLDSKFIPLSTAKAQLLFSPLVLFFIWYFILKPTLKINLSVLFWIVITGLILSYVTLDSLMVGSNNVLFTVLKGDDLATQSRIDREFLQSALDSIGDLHVSSIYSSVHSKKEALKLLNKYPGSKGIIWGSPYRIEVTFQEFITAEEINTQIWLKELSGVKIISQISSYGVSYNPYHSTARIVAGSFSDRISVLEAVSTIDERWPTRTHRGYIFFRMANQYFKEAIATHIYQPGAMDCAIQYFQTAFRMVKESENMELRRAISNNLSIALAIRGKIDNKSEDLKDSRFFILLAARQADNMVKPEIDSIRISIQNSNYIKKYLGQIK